MILFFSVAGLVMSAIPALMFVRNLPLFCAPWPDRADDETPSVSILIPARDEGAAIEASVTAALASEHVNLEAVVLDDNSTDQTREIVESIADQDPRVRCIAGQPLPDGWNGKQYACRQLASAAQHEWLVFLDADVRLRPPALARLITRAEQTDTALLSAFPHQQTGTWLEKWLIPMMHYLLLGYLPIDRMRRSTDPAYASGCGQLFVTPAADYERSGGHAAIKASRHDGIKLPRAYRTAGLSSDVVDGTDLAECRMYVGSRQVIRGALKNAVEGVANPKIIVVFTVLLLGASLLPVVTLVWAFLAKQTLAALVSALALLIAHIPRALAASRFRQSWFGAACHTLASPLFVALQWLALLNHLTGRQVRWRGRAA